MLCVHSAIMILSFIMVTKTNTIKYSKLFNPIFVFLPFLFAYYVVVRVGVLSEYYYPRYDIFLSLLFSLIND